MIACLQDLHNLHCQSSDTQLPRLLFRNRQAKIQFPAADDHVPHDVVDCVSVNACSCGDNIANIPAIAPEKLSGAWKGLMTGFGREEAIEIAFKQCRPVDRVVRALPLVMFMERRFQ